MCGKREVIILERNDDLVIVDVVQIQRTVTLRHIGGVENNDLRVGFYSGIRENGAEHRAGPFCREIPAFHAIQIHQLRNLGIGLQLGVG